MFVTGSIIFGMSTGGSGEASDNPNRPPGRIHEEIQTTTGHSALPKTRRLRRSEGEQRVRGWCGEGSHRWSESGSYRNQPMVTETISRY